VFKSGCGKLLVYASAVVSRKERLQSVKVATEKTAKLLDLGFEVIRFRKNFSQIYVYYENGDDDPIPIYSDEGKEYDLQEICATLRNMMFVLSFHPRHSALRQARKIMRLS
jgi:hypothetical protein